MTLMIYKMYIKYASMHPMHLKKGIIIPIVSYWTSNVLITIIITAY